MFPDGGPFGDVPEMRGPVVYIGCIPDCDTKELYEQSEFTLTSLTAEKTNFYNVRYHKSPFIIEPENKTEMIKKDSLRLWKISTELPICETACEACRIMRRFYKDCTDKGIWN